MYNLSQLLVACQQFVASQCSWLLGHLRKKHLLICRRKAFSCKLSSRLGMILGLSLHSVCYLVLAKHCEYIHNVACSGKGFEQIKFSDFKCWGEVRRSTTSEMGGAGFVTDLVCSEFRNYWGHQNGKTEENSEASSTVDIFCCNIKQP